MYNTQQAQDEKQIASNKLKIDELINHMNTENFEETHRQISILKLKNIALLGERGEAMDYGIIVAAGNKSI